MGKTVKLSKIYILKEGVTEEQLIAHGFEKIQIGDECTYIRPVIFELEDELPQSMINNFYNNPKWKKAIYDNNKEIIKEAIDLEYNENGEAIITDNLAAIICGWRFQIDLDGDRWVGFTSGDPFDQQIFCQASAIEKYCAEELEDMKDIITTTLVGQ